MVTSQIARAVPKDSFSLESPANRSVPYKTNKETSSTDFPAFCQSRGLAQWVSRLWVGRPLHQWDVWRSSQGRGRTSASHSGLSLTTNIPRARLVIIFRWIITKSQLRFETPDKGLRTLTKVPRNLQLLSIFRQKIDGEHGNYQVYSLSAAISAILHSITFRHCLEL